MNTHRLLGCVFTILLASPLVSAAPLDEPLVGSSTVIAEKDGFVAVEAEHFFKQTQADKRAFYLTHTDRLLSVSPDGDPQHVDGASGNAYLEILPDTRRTHDDKLIKGTNFSPKPGQMAVLHYKVHFETPGRYYVWGRAFSTGSEDNGLHVGIDGRWPESGQRLQWCKGKKTWRWDSMQRTEEQHCGEPHKIFLDIDEAGEHEIMFSMREDGFEFDQWLMTTDREFERPEGVVECSKAKTGKLPEPFAEPFPKLKRGAAPKRDDPSRQAAYTPVSKTDKVSKQEESQSTSLIVMPASEFADGSVQGYYVDKGKWMAINPERVRIGSAARTFNYPSGRYDITLRTVGENDGRSTYRLSLDGTEIGRYQNPLGSEMFQEGKKFHKTWENISITEGAIVKITSQIGSNDGEEFSRARWSAVAFRPADANTNAAVAPLLAKAARANRVASKEASMTSPTKNSSDKLLQSPRGDDGDGSVSIEGETKLWHKVTLDLSGPFAHEKDNQPNPFTDYRMDVTFTHPSGSKYVVPGYFAADGKAAQTSAEAGNVWRAHFAPDQTGTWKYEVAFYKGSGVALDLVDGAEKVSPYDGASGMLDVAVSDKTGRDLRAEGRLQYVGQRYLKFAESGRYFLKVGADAPETLLAFKDFDNTVAGNPKKAPLKSWSKHVRDWKGGDPSWSDGKGKGLIGAINYLSGKGCNAFSFLTYNAGGDGDNVWPFIDRDDKLHYDCSKLDQWGIVFDHGTARGMYLHFKMQETENDDHRKGTKNTGFVSESLDGGNLGTQRKLYCRELVARFGHNLALNWNLGEENTQSTEQQIAMIDYIAATDPYDHPIVVHTYPNQQDKIYRPLLGDKSKLTGVSLQNSSLKTTHEQTVKWVRASEAAGKPWVVAFDESGSAKHAQCPDLGYQGFDGRDRQGNMAHTQHEVRKQTLWGTLMGGGAGNEYYFGYQFVENDIVCEDWRSRDQSWDYCRIAIEFFYDNDVPFWKMQNADELVGNPDHGIDRFCLAKPDDTYVVYLPSGGNQGLDLTAAKGDFRVQWYNPRSGGDLTAGSTKTLSGGDKRELGNPPSDPGEDWVVLVRRAASKQ